jgi:hypothetical protein
MRRDFSTILFIFLPLENANMGLFEGLFKPAWQSKNAQKAERAVKKMTNQLKLQRVIKESYDAFIIKAAIKNLTDQNIISDIAKNPGEYSLSEYGYEYREIIKKLSDQDVLAYISKNAKDKIARIEAMKKLTDHRTLVDSIKNDRDDNRNGPLVTMVRMMIKDETLLSDLAKNANDGWIRFEAAVKLTDKTIEQEVLSNLANSHDSILCIAAADNLTDKSLAQSVYAKIAHKATKDAHRNQLATKDTIMADIGANAVDKLTDQKLLIEVATGNATARVRYAAIKRLTDCDVLAMIANSKDEKYGIHRLGFGVEFDLSSQARTRLEELERK